MTMLAAAGLSGCQREQSTQRDALPQRKPLARAATMPVVRPWKMRPLPANEVNLIGMGDWGSDANNDQKSVAKALAEYMARVPTQFHGLLSVGDNLYCKLKNTHDMNWQTVFEDMYDPERVNCPFYCVLGNHDYEENKPRVQLAYAIENPHSRWKFPSKWYRLEFPADNPLVSVLMLDSDYHKLSRREHDDQLDWLHAELAKPRSTWMVAAGHHPLFSNGVHGDVGILQYEWGVLFRKYHVNLYVSGHEHNLQHLELPGWPISFVLAGAGGRGFTPMRRDRGPFARQIYGFTHLRFLPDYVAVTYIDNKGRRIHEFMRDLHGNVSVMFTTANDKIKNVKPLKPFDEGDSMTSRVPSFDPEPAMPPTTQPMIEVKRDI